MDALFIIGRVIIALYFVTMGLNHFTKRDALAHYGLERRLPFAGTAVAVSGVMLFVSGISILLGIYTAVGIWCGVIFLAGAAFLVHHFWTDTDPGKRVSEMTNFLKNLALAAALLMLLSVPTPWVFSL